MNTAHAPVAFIETATPVGAVVAVCSSPRHGFSKQPQLSIRLLAGQGVQGDAHSGETVQHVYLKRRTPDAPNRMQVHLLPCELFDQLALAGFQLNAGQLGENVTTRGIDLVTLPLGTLLHLGEEAMIELTGLRRPCSQIDKFQPGLLKQVVERDTAHRLLAKAGVMAVVLQSGEVFPGSAIVIELPPLPHQPLQMI